MPRQDLNMFKKLGSGLPTCMDAVYDARTITHLAPSNGVDRNLFFYATSSPRAFRDCDDGTWPGVEVHCFRFCGGDEVQEDYESRCVHSCEGDENIFPFCALAVQPSVSTPTVYDVLMARGPLLTVTRVDVSATSRQRDDAASDVFNVHAAGDPGTDFVQAVEWLRGSVFVAASHTLSPSVICHVEWIADNGRPQITEQQRVDLNGASRLLRSPCRTFVLAHEGGGGVSLLRCGSGSNDDDEHECDAPVVVTKVAEPMHAVAISVEGRYIAFSRRASSDIGIVEARALCNTGDATCVQRVSVQLDHNRPELNLAEQLAFSANSTRLLSWYGSGNMVLLHCVVTATLLSKLPMSHRTRGVRFVIPVAASADDDDGGVDCHVVRFDDIEIRRWSVKSRSGSRANCQPPWIQLLSATDAVVRSLQERIEMFESHFALRRPRDE